MDTFISIIPYTLKAMSVDRLLKSFKSLFACYSVICVVSRYPALDHLMEHAAIKNKQHYYESMTSEKLIMIVTR